MVYPQLANFLLVGIVFFAAGVVKGVLGMGLPTLAMGLLGTFMPVPQAAGLLTAPSFVTNVWQAARGSYFKLLLRRLAGMQVGICAGVAIAAWLPAQDDHRARWLLGACLLAYGSSGLAGLRLRTPGAATARALGPLVGMLTGIITAITGVFVLPAVPFLQSLALDRRQLVQALGISFTTSTIALAAFLSGRGQLGIFQATRSLVFLVPALAGMWVGQKARDAMSERMFRNCFFAGISLLGAWLAVA
jgi:uncharacterized membrane protein YfcA